MSVSLTTKEAPFSYSLKTLLIVCITIMAESAYHNEALRRQRAIERKNEAQRRLLNGPQVKKSSNSR
jgi:hypothetical protein